MVLLWDGYSSFSLKLPKFWRWKDSEANKENTFLTLPVSGSKKGKRAAASMSRLLSQAIIAAYTIGSLVIVCPSSDLKAIVPVLHTIITSGSSDPKLNKLMGTAVSIKYTAPSLYIQAWLTMGKVCLADGKLAKRYIPLFVQVCIYDSLCCVDSPIFPKYPCLTVMKWVWVWDICPTNVPNLDSRIL